MSTIKQEKHIEGLLASGQCEIVGERRRPLMIIGKIIYPAKDLVQYECKNGETFEIVKE